MKMFTTVAAVQNACPYDNCWVKKAKNQAGNITGLDKSKILCSRFVFTN